MIIINKKNKAVPSSASSVFKLIPPVVFDYGNSLQLTFWKFLIFYHARSVASLAYQVLSYIYPRWKEFLLT